LAQHEDIILDRFGVDAVDVGRAFNNADTDWYDIRLFNGNTAQYPTWFKPHQEADGSWIAFAADGTLIAKMPANQYHRASAAISKSRLPSYPCLHIIALYSTRMTGLF